MNKVWISSMTFNDGNIISFNKNDIIVIVGPNNAGKSVTLKEAIVLLRTNTANSKILSSITVEIEGTAEQLVETLTNNSQKYFQREDGNQVHYRGLGYDLSEYQAKNNWTAAANGLGGKLCDYFAISLSTEQRLVASNPPINYNITQEAPKHPIHILQRDDQIEKLFDNAFHLAFGKNLIVHRNAGSKVPLYVGDKPELQAGEDRMSIRYIRELEKLDLLDEQGDGLRSFVGVLLNAIVGNQTMLFIDEPEAFLHPPQARLLASMLAKKIPVEKQLFLATHSADFIKGLLDANVPNMKIIRIQREKNTNHVTTLDQTQIQNIWKDSLLRHSNILSGLFHSEVIICESDSDCRFFSAILDSLEQDSERKRSDALFIHVGGKHRIPVALRALKELNVPVKVVSDFDLLNNISPLKDIFELLEGEWETIETFWNTVKSGIEHKRPEFLTTELKVEIDSIIESNTDRIFQKSNIKEIQKALKKSSPWTEAKELGKTYIPSGNASELFERMQLILKSKGLYILEGGEIEGFVKSVGGHGPKWVNGVLEKNLKSDPELEPARQFLKNLLDIQN
jgi:predicted ATPase